MDKLKILTAKELRTIMPRLSGWKLVHNKPSRTFEFQDFVQSLSFVNSLVRCRATISMYSGPRSVPVNSGALVPPTFDRSWAEERFS